MPREQDFEPYLEHLRAVPFVTEARLLELASARHGQVVDAQLLVKTPAGQTTLGAELKRTHLTHELAERLLHVRGLAPNLIVLAPFVGRDLAERFGRAHLNFVDLAGNFHLEVADRYYAHVEGRRPETKPAMMRALRAPAYQVLFALLAKPELVSASARALADAAGGVSPQTAIDVRRRLHERGFLVGPSKSPKWGPSGRKGALDLFVSGFATTLAPSLAVGRFRARQREISEMEAALATRLDEITTWRWGGGAACQRLTGYFRGDTTVVYVDHASPKLAADLQLVADRQGPISIAKRPSPLAFESPAPQTVHPLLAYVDLLIEGEERATEGAREIHARYLQALDRGLA
jgi:hypothetical protein